MKNLHRVIGGAAARGRFPADQAGVAQAAHIHAVIAVVPRAPAFTREFGDAVDAAGVHHRGLGREHFGAARAEGGNRTGPEHPQGVAARQLQHIQQTFHVQVPGPLGMLLTTGRQGRGQQIDLRDGKALHHSAQGVGVGRIEGHMAHAQQACLRGRLGRDVTGHDRLRTVAQCEGFHQVGTDLAIGPDDQNARRAHVDLLTQSGRVRARLG